MASRGTHTVWIELDTNALEHNVTALRQLVGPDKLLCIPVKGNAYGHGLAAAAAAFANAGADWLAVHSVGEAAALRAAGVSLPLYILGYVPLAELPQVLELDCEILVNTHETAAELERLAAATNQTARVHLKAETGTNRQGLLAAPLLTLAEYIASQPHLTLAGLSTHFANIEDTLNTEYFENQRAEFQQAQDLLRDHNLLPPLIHCANSAATLLFPETHGDLVRPGIAAYGMWPSQYTKLSWQQKFPDQTLELRPALAWKSLVAQIKDIPAGACVSYGCTYTTTRQTRLAVVPVGYADGYDRALGNRAEVLVAGERAPVLGRVCMNNIMIDITDIPAVTLEDEVVLLGPQGSNRITAEELATWADTINYEITTRIVV